MIEGNDNGFEPGMCCIWYNDRMYLSIDSMDECVICVLNIDGSVPTQGMELLRDCNMRPSQYAIRDDLVKIIFSDGEYV